MDKHETYGGEGEGYSLPRSVECPFCGGKDTQLETPFGSVLSVAQYYCRKCKTVFEWIKRDAERPRGT
ncbi:MAG: hypothetical protein GWN99_20180 [Gemmatimonadetes bacterium]|uniref:PaaD zinc beta ribbon domain-containing protein n=1 Tax=Candidatus Kutchimonas denitrificans TaxID=3056748 RepID=A0AAE4ZBV5_9BACT|nr:hypothetical protein [Gemmatimonadota bacterium]NIR76522.1 hypothetical protein [Candidatus Kutchimonas denitrificans]NIS03340.1 hypothetical protein [Gemmatimonadota bacterium]NIT69201.1 hypothetical protein [Gemmatimonadota bacterium]NIU54593.1 hypothetical protein [Gemmatimonadota bacterium]